MMQYRPLDRPSASDVLQHRWFQRSPALTYAPEEMTGRTGGYPEKEPRIYRI